MGCRILILLWSFGPLKASPIVMFAHGQANKRTHLELLWGQVFDFGLVSGSMSTWESYMSVYVVVANTRCTMAPVTQGPKMAHPSRNVSAFLQGAVKTSQLLARGSFGSDTSPVKESCQDGSNMTHWHPTWIDGVNLRNEGRAFTRPPSS